MGEWMIRTVSVALTAVLFSAAWYLGGGLLEREKLNNHGSLSVACLDRHEPQDSVHAEGTPLPSGDYVFIPMTLTCDFELSDGSRLQSSHANWEATFIALVPLIFTLLWGIWWILRRTIRGKRLSLPQDAKR